MKNPLSRISLSRVAVLLLTMFVSVSVFAQALVFPGRVVNVVNGDTVTVLTQSNTEFQVRCQGIDAPKGEETSASDSRQRLTDLLLDEPVVIRSARREHDGTLVGTILVNDRDICLDQLKVGLARYDNKSELTRSTQQQYARAESGARSNRAGLWSVPTPATKTLLPESSPLTTAASDIPKAPTDSNKTVNVRGYFKKDGTYVAAHKRTAADDNFNNNWSTQGNVNPYTGKAGTKKRSRWITALKWIGVGAALGALIYLDAKYATPTARCNDGTYSYSRHRQGTCSHHGGVAYWLY